MKFTYDGKESRHPNDPPRPNLPGTGDLPGGIDTGPQSDVREIKTKENVPIFLLPKGRK